MTCLYCSADRDLTITGERRCRDFWPCWTRYCAIVDAEDAAKKARVAR